MKKRALISVSDKSGVVEFAKGLADLGYEIISTGGTEKALNAAGISTINISDITEFPECLDGRVKTLHPAVHAGLLAMRSNPAHMEKLVELGLNTIDVVCVNLYPFKETISKPNVEFGEAVENIDIGGPTMLRSAAKNYQDVLVVIDPSDYATVLDGLKNNSVTMELRKTLMYKVYSHTAYYDSMISNYLARQLCIDFPEQKTIALDKVQTLRYGENPHQKAAFYKEAFCPSGTLARAEQLQGKELSYNNINDAGGALELLREFTCPCAVAVKHANPCGVGIGNSLLEAYNRAYAADPISIFGGIVALNRRVEKALAEELIKTFLEIVIAPEFDDAALEVFKAKPNLRVLRLADISVALPANALDMKKVAGGMLMQGIDTTVYADEDVVVVTKVKPSEEDLINLRFAYAVVKHTKSNAIALWKDSSSVGIGVGQTNRIWAAKQAIEHAGDRAKGAYLASDAFFPFPDCVEEAAKAGIKCIVQPGGSNNDKLSIEACDKHGIAMIFCGSRHFKH